MDTLDYLINSFFWISLLSSDLLIGCAQNFPALIGFLVSANDILIGLKINKKRISSIDLDIHNIRFSSSDCMYTVDMLILLLDSTARREST